MQLLVKIYLFFLQFLRFINFKSQLCQLLVEISSFYKIILKRI